MKNQLLVILLVGSSALFAQQEEQRLKERKSNYNPMMFNLGEHGTAYVIMVGYDKASVNYISADGQVKWASEKVKINAESLSYDDAGFVVYSSSISTGIVKTTSTIQFLRYDFAKKAATEGDFKLKDAFITMIHANGKLWYLSQSESGSGLVKLYLVEANPKTLEPLGEPKLIAGLPENKQDYGLRNKLGGIKGSVSLYWTLAGFDDNYLLFYGKKSDATNGKVQYEFVKTDYAGKKVAAFKVDIELADKKYVQRTNILRNINERMEAYSTRSTTETTSSFNNKFQYTTTYAGVMVDAGNFGACHVDMSKGAIYCYGTYGDKPDDASAQPVGYYIQKHNMTGERIWHYQTSDDLIKKSWAYSYAAPEKVYLKVRTWPSVPTRLALNSATGRVMLFDYPFNMFSVDSLGMHPEFYAIPTLSEKEREQESKNASWDNQTLRELCPMRHNEVLSSNLTEALFGAVEGKSLEDFASKNEKNALKYTVQQLQNGLRVMTYDEKKKECVIWRFGE